jgi:AcrR family transcriptional regulator
MRVTAEAKAVTRQRILEAARQLFATGGFDTSTTRDIADAAGIATGTLFSYFPTKEALLAALAAEAVSGVDQDFEESDGESFEEERFAFVSAGLRGLKPLRKHLPGLLETTLIPLAPAPGEEGQSLRVSHLETVARLATKRGAGELSPVALQLYWTLYTGVLLFWAQDRSHKQEDTLALLDDSLAMFAGWLQRENNDSPANQRGGKRRGPVGKRTLACVVRGGRSLTRGPRGFAGSKSRIRIKSRIKSTPND